MADEHVLNIKVKVSKDTKQITVVESELKGLEGQTYKVGQSAKETTGSFNELSSGMQSLLSPLGINIAQFSSLAGVLGAVGTTIATGIKEWENELSMQRQLSATLKGLGLNYDNLKNSIEDTLASLTANTRFTQDEARQSFISALKYTGDTTSAFRLLKIAQDAAISSNKGLEETMNTLGLALRGDQMATRILYREFGMLGIQGATAEEKVRNLGKALEGAAKTEQSLTKESIKLKEQFTETAEIIGESLSPYLIGALNGIKSFVTGAVSFVGMLVNTVLDGIDWIGGEYSKLVRTIEYLSEKLKAIVTLNFKAIKDANLRYVRDIKDIQTMVAKESEERWTKFAEKTEQQFEKIGKTANDVNKNISDGHINTNANMLEDDKEKAREVKEILKEVEEAYKESEKRKLEAKKSTDEQAIKTEQAKKNMFTAMKMDEIKETYITEEQKLAILSQSAGQMANVFKGVGEIGKAFAIAQATIDTYAAANKALATYPPPFSFIAAAAAIASGLANVSKITSVALAEGGIVTKPTHALIGEKGAEAVIPLDKARLGNVSIGNINIQFPNVSSLEDWRKANPREIKEIVEKKILYAMDKLAKEGKMASIVNIKNI